MDMKCWFESDLSDVRDMKLAWKSVACMGQWFIVVITTIVFIMKQYLNMECCNSPTTIKYSIEQHKYKLHGNQFLTNELVINRKIVENVLFVFHVKYYYTVLKKVY